MKTILALASNPKRTSVLALDREIRGIREGEWDRSSLSLDFVEQEKDWVLAMDNLPSGLYRVTVKTETNGEQVPSPVHDLFEVVRQ